MAVTPILPVLLSGGVGTRLWPLSRALYPKQLIALASDRTMLQETALRAADPARFSAPMVICNDDHRFIVAEQLRAIGINPQRIVLEPEGRNTAPASALAALIAGEARTDQIVLVLPSDHVIADLGAFDRAIDAALPAAMAGYLVTFGIAPDRPETGYGYIRLGSPLDNLAGVRAVEKFVEKPDMATASAYLASGGYAWNGGIFMFRADAMCAEMEHHAPSVLAAARAALAQGRIDGGFQFPAAEAFAQAPAISLDYAVMEKTTRAAVVPVDMGWSDVGSWHALWQVRPRDQNDNYIEGDVLAEQSTGSYLFSTGPLLAGLGLKDMVVIATEDAVFVAPRARAHEVGQLVNRLKAAHRSEAHSHKVVHRPWGTFQTIDEGERFKVKRIVVNPGAMISLQYHHHRAEHWVVVKGTARVTRNDEVFLLQENQSAYIPAGAHHRLENPGGVPLHIIEVQSGDYVGEDDIVRLGDIYGRKETEKPI